ncbi:MAG: Rne/Rng family ribonuclease [Phycisphaera sp.]|nr:Rne/Rng family ribonuclease [Phycisphaera sp.]
MPKRDMLINYVPGEECRIAITEDGRLEEFYQERAGTESHVGNIYKGRVTNVEPSIQAAFVEFGLERNGFLHISDLHPKYFPGKDREEFERVGQKTPRRERPPIQKCLRRGQELLVQVLKEGIGTKGPTLTSYLSIPGRFIVMMPHMERLGVSRKVDDDDARRAVRDLLDQLKPPEGFGFIVRTAGIGRNKTDLKRDLAYLQRLWKTLETRMEKVNVGELYTESDLVVRTIRDVFSSDIDRILCDNEIAAKRARAYLGIASPRAGSNVLLYEDDIPLFHRYDIESQIENINARTVPLPSGGSLVIDSTEALVAIDVNSGKNRENSDAEQTAYKTNLEAADEICRQLRLRDLGGVVVNDMIDMVNLKHRRAVEARFKANLKNDRARTRTASISPFGILEMTRQRMRPSLKKSLYAECAACSGAGQVKSAESVVLDVIRRLAVVLHHRQVSRIDLTVSPDVAFLLLNRRRHTLVSLEQRYDKPVMVRVNGGGPIDFLHIAAFDERDGAIDHERLKPSSEPRLTPVEGPPDEMLDSLDEESQDDANDEHEAPHDGAHEQEGHNRTTARHDQHDEPSASDHDQGDEQKQDQVGDSQGQATDGQPASKKRRRRRRGGRGRNRGDATQTHAAPEEHPPTQSDTPPRVTAKADDQFESAPHHDDEPTPGNEHNDESSPPDVDGNVKSDSPVNTSPPGEGGGRRRRRRRRGGRGRRRSGANANAQNTGDSQGESSGNTGQAHPPQHRDNNPTPEHEPFD